MNGDYEIDKETFLGLGVEQQNWMMFKTYNRDRDVYEKRFTCIETEHTKLSTRFDRRKKFDTAAAGSGGVLGGFIAVVGMLFMKMMGWSR